VKKVLPTARICLECSDMPWIFAQIAEDNGITTFYSKSATALRKFSETSSSEDITLFLTGKMMEKQIKRLAKFPEIQAVAVSGVDEAVLLNDVLASEVERAMKKRRSKVSLSRERFLDKNEDSREGRYLQSVNILLRVTEKDASDPQGLFEKVQTIEENCPSLSFLGILGDSAECLQVYSAIKGRLDKELKENFQIIVPFDEDKSPEFYRKLSLPSQNVLWLVEKI